MSRKSITNLQLKYEWMTSKYFNIFCPPIKKLHIVMQIFNSLINKDKFQRNK